MAMDWHDLLFMHWRVKPEQLRPFVPPTLELEIYDGSAWLGIVPFVMRGTRARLTPPVPGLSRFPELNVRTYVRPVAGPERDKPGVWFFSLDATRRIAVEAARLHPPLGFTLPYFKATMSAARDGDWIDYEHQRTDSNRRIVYGEARSTPAGYRARYRPTGPVRLAEPESLESFLTDRYRLYSWNGALFYGDIHHPPWPLQPAEADVTTNTMAGYLGIDQLEGRPLLHFSRSVKVAAWWPRRTRGV